MTRLRFGALLCVTLLPLANLGHASMLSFGGTLTGANENPAVASAGTGSALVTLDTVTGLLGISVSFSGLTGLTTASHIHCCVLPNGNAGVATTVPTFAGFPLGVTSGTYNTTLDLTLSSSYNPAFVTLNGGTVASAEAALVAGLENGMSYLNIHTSTSSTGEVRALLQPVPEPVTASLVFSAIALLCCKRRR